MNLKQLCPNDFEEVNIVPVDDCIVHIDGLECTCSPTWDSKNQWDLQEGRAIRMMVVHRRIRDEVLH